MSLVDSVIGLRHILVNEHAAQTGCVFIYGESLNALLWDCADDQIDAFGQLTEREQEALILDVCPDGAEYRPRPICIQ